MLQDVTVRSAFPISEAGTHDLTVRVVRVNDDMKIQHNTFSRLNPLGYTEADMSAVVNIPQKKQHSWVFNI